MKEKGAENNPLGTLPVTKLLAKFAVPSVIAMLVSALYNIVDQFFIGRKVGELGNAATNIAFPLSISCVAIALLFGIGGASAFNLSMGKGEKEEAVYYAGNAAVLLFGCGVVLSCITLLFLNPLLKFFGAPDKILGYAEDYVGITALGFPFLILATGGGHLIRADGSPKFTMFSNLAGAVVNTILDAAFVFGMGWGMKGAAAATVIGQILSGAMAFWYLRHYKTAAIERKHLRIRWKYAGRIMSLGAAPCSNQLAMMVVQIVMNNSLTHYGAVSDYGESIPLACAGIISKVNQVYFSFIIGISQGQQPIVSYNYGARKYLRVKEAYQKVLVSGFVISLTAFLMFQIFPRRLIGLFGSGSEAYYRFAVRYFRIFLLITCLNFLQPVTSNLFTAIGKPVLGMFLALTRQILFLLPLMVVLPLFLQIDGILYAGPAADFLAVIVSAAMAAAEFRKPQYKKTAETAG